MIALLTLKGKEVSKISKDVFVGDTVYFYNSKLDEIIQGTIEGYYTEDYSILKILQKVSDGVLRHVVPITSMSKSLSEVEVLASKLRREKVNEVISKDVYAGCVVNLKDLNGSVVTDNEGNILKYQVIAVYTKQARVKLVTHYGEEIGLYSIEDLIITDEDPLFKMEDYYIGQDIIWIEYDNVYEGKISKLHSSTAEISNVKKLYSTDFRKKVPYYKIDANNIHTNNTENVILTTIKDIIPQGEED